MTQTLVKFVEFISRLLQVTPNAQPQWQPVRIENARPHRRRSPPRSRYYD